MAATSLLVVASLRVFVALSACLLLVLLVRRHRASGTTLKDAARATLAKWSGPLRFLTITAVLVVGADYLLPTERIHTEVYHQQSVDTDTIKVTYGVCCTGGGIASCDTSRQPALALNQAIVVQRSRILDRCSVEPSPSPPMPCKCS